MDLSELNEEQKEAVTSTEGFFRVVAGAGSGKTKALVNRFAFLVTEIGILPSNILCVTFTNKSANEMRSRIRLITGDNDTGFISTFHGFCVSVLKEDSNSIQYPKNFLVLDNSDIDTMLSIIYEERNLSLRQMTFSNARDMIEMKKLFQYPEYYLDILRMTLDEIYLKYKNATKTDDIIFYGYLYQEKKCFGLDYNDLIKFTLYIFKSDKEICLKWQKQLEYIMVDEFQDIDSLQYELLETLCDYHKNLFIVGDPDQTIYTWRGADVRFLLNFDKKFDNVKTIMMNTNYRSSPEIIHASNSLIAKNSIRIPKNLISTKESISKPTFYHAKTTKEEAEFISDKINELLQKGYHHSDITILYRSHFLSRTIEEEFITKKIPYTLFSGLPFFDRKEIKDSLSFLRMIAYKDDLSFLRICNTPKRNLGNKRIKFLKEMSNERNKSLYECLKDSIDEEIFTNTKAKDFIQFIEKYASSYQNMKISELFSFVMNENGYERELRTEGAQDRLDNLAELKQSIFEYEASCGEEASLDDYLAHTALFTNSDAGTVKQAIKMMTIHTAKGLEFPVVFICGMNENLFPSKKISTPAEMEEERRLAFVAFTRAENELFLTDAEGSENGFGYRYPSRFIFDVEKDLLDYAKELPEKLEEEAKHQIQLSIEKTNRFSIMNTFKIGNNISHKIFGKGIILEIDEIKFTYLIKFESLPTPRRLGFSAPITLL